MSGTVPPAPTGWALRAYLAATWLLTPLVPLLLRRRLARGKEDPARFGEKLGHASLPRPDGPLIWLHAVGIGEVMALRGLIGLLAGMLPGHHFLVTSTARASAGVFARNVPERTLHQFLPVDAPPCRRRFLDHWRPALAVWCEQDLWPGLVVETHRRGIPLALVNARYDAASVQGRERAGNLYRDLYRRFSLLAAQDETSARFLEAMRPEAEILRHLSLKASAPALSVDEAALAAMRAATAGRRVWCLASSHAEDEAVALAAQALRLAADPGALLVIVPRVVARGGAIAAMARQQGLRAALRSAQPLPGPADQVFVADRFGELGLWFRLCPVALMGGTFGPVEGHNPWEPARLGAAVLHGPRVANFAADFARLDAARAAREVGDAEAVAAALGEDLSPLAERARTLAESGAADTERLARRLAALIGGRRGDV